MRLLLLAENLKRVLDGLSHVPSTLTALVSRFLPVFRVGNTFRSLIKLIFGQSILASVFSLQLTVSETSDVPVG